MADGQARAEFHLPGLDALRREEMWEMVQDDNFRTALVTGCAGSGKTTVSVYRLIRLNNQGEAVSLLTLQNMLVTFIKNLVVNNTGNNVEITEPVPEGSISTFHKWYWDQTRCLLGDGCEVTSAEVITVLDNCGIQRNQDAEVIIDEGQDLPPAIYEALPLYFSRVMVGADKAQQVHHGADPDLIAEIFDRQAQFIRYPLGQNFRNTYETYKFARQFLPQEEYQEVWNESILERLQAKNRVGRKPVVITYTTTSARDAHIHKTLRNATGVVGILCPIGALRKERYSGESVEGMYNLVTNWGHEATHYYSNDDDNNPCEVPYILKPIIVTTFISAKGLEFDTVIVPRMNFFRDPVEDSETKIREEMYVACTRAKSRLYVYRDSTNPSKYDPISTFDPSTYDGPEEE